MFRGVGSAKCISFGAYCGNGGERSDAEPGGGVMLIEAIARVGGRGFAVSAGSEREKRFGSLPGKGAATAATAGGEAGAVGDCRERYREMRPALFYPTETGGGWRAGATVPDRYYLRN